MRFFLVGSSDRIPGQNLGSSPGHLTTTRQPTNSWVTFGTHWKPMWCPETSTFPFSSKLTLYFTTLSSAKKKNYNDNKQYVSFSSLCFQMNYENTKHKIYSTYIVVYTVFVPVWGGLIGLRRCSVCSHLSQSGVFCGFKCHYVWWSWPK